MLKKENNKKNEIILPIKNDINNLLDADFDCLLTFLEGKSVQDMEEIIKHNFEYISKYDKYNYTGIVAFYNMIKLWGEIDLENGVYDLINNNAKTLVENIEDIKWLYSKLGDYRSKKILVAVLYYWLQLDHKRVTQLQDQNYAQYFDLDLVKCDKNEVFVDIGGYIGDTLISYVNAYGRDMYEKLYTYEIVPINLEYIQKNMDKFHVDRVEIKAKGVSDKKGLLFLSKDEVSSTSQLQTEGEIKVPTVTIDQDIKGRVSFIKMDIEGAEKNALLGCKDKIAKYHPKLALSVYHNNNHLFELAQIIESIDPTYKFYLRYYGGKLLPTEYILYAI